MQTIPIIAVFDTYKLLHAGTSDDILHPVKAPPGSLYMVVGEKNLGASQASGDLVVDSQVGDVLQWSAASVSGNRDDQVVFSGFEAFVPGIFTQPLPRILHPVHPASEEDAVKGFGPNAISALWTADIIGVGASLYKFAFIIRYTDDNGEIAFSHYIWESEMPTVDPITIETASSLADA